MNEILDIILTAVRQAALSLMHNWPYLFIGIFMSALLRQHVDAGKASAFLKRFRGLGVVAATGAAVGTPLCSCGTTAVILGMMASTMPWAPVVAFMVASPLTSPQELVYSAGLFGWPFALAFFAASILLGLAGGGVAALLENLGWLAGQARFSAPARTEPAPVAVPAALQPAAACACAAPTAQLVSLQPAPAAARRAWPRLSRAEATKAAARGLPFLREFYAAGRQLLPMFLGFAFIGYLINGLIPASWVEAVFGGGNAYSVPLAATLALPLYINTEGSLPLVRALLDNGMSQGAALAFLIAGSGTSIGAVAGALTIARWRVVGLVIGVLWAGAILTGYGYDQLLALGLF